MYGLPLTIYILLSLLNQAYPSLNLFGHIQGHLWVVFFKVSETGFLIIHFLGSLVILTGLFLLVEGWRKNYQARGELVTTGIYGLIRHPQYLGLFLIASGLFIMWPTIPILILWPILLFAYSRLAKREEKEIEVLFGEKFLKYREEVPMFFPMLSSLIRRPRMKENKPKILSISAGSKRNV